MTINTHRKFSEHNYYQTITYYDISINFPSLDLAEAIIMHRSPCELLNTQYEQEAVEEP